MPTTTDTTQPIQVAVDDKPGPALAVVLETERAYIATDNDLVDSHTESPPVTTPPIDLPHKPIPPAAIVPRFAGEPMEADLTWPPHPRGSGDTWPKEARVEHQAPPGRFPAAYAWSMLGRGASWNWRHEGLNSSIGPAAALTRMLAEAMRVAPTHTHRAHALVIPSSLPARARQNLQLAADKATGETRLISRAEAARAAWSAMHAEAQLDLAPPSPNDPPSSQPTLLHLHLGLHDWEFTAIDLRARSIREARRHTAHLSSYGLLLMHQLATRALEVSYRKASIGRTWELMWCSPWMVWTLDVLTAANPKLPDPLRCLAAHARTDEFVKQQHRFAAQQALGVGIESPAMLGDLLEPTPRFTDVRDWFAAIKSKLEAMRITGAIVTGAMAALPHADSTLGRHYLDQVWNKPRNLVIEGIDLPRGILSHGALRAARSEIHS